MTSIYHISHSTTYPFYFSDFLFSYFLYNTLSLLMFPYLHLPFLKYLRINSIYSHSFFLFLQLLTSYILIFYFFFSIVTSLIHLNILISALPILGSISFFLLPNIRILSTIHRLMKLNIIICNS